MDANITIPVLEPITHSVQFLMNTVQVIVGGIFGIYVILLILRWKEARDLKKLLKSVNDQLLLLNKTVKKLEKKFK